MKSGSKMADPMFRILSWRPCRLLPEPLPLPRLPHPQPQTKSQPLPGGVAVGGVANAETSEAGEEEEAPTIIKITKIVPLQIINKLRLLLHLVTNLTKRVNVILMGPQIVPVPATGSTDEERPTVVIPWFVSGSTSSPQDLKIEKSANLTNVK